jgi:heat shock protein HslJ
MTNLRTTVLAVVFACVTALAVACGDRGEDPGATRGLGAGLLRTGQDATYVVTAVTVKGEPHALAKGSEIRLRFEGRRLGITAGCNSMGGDYTLDGTRLTVDGLASTEMGCAAPLMAQDAWVAGLFDKPVQLTTGNDAAIISGDVVLALTDREVASPDVALEGTRWRLDTLIEGELASSVPAGSAAWLQIDGDSLRFDIGCTGGSGTVQAAGDQLSFGDIGFQATPCRPGDVLYPAFSQVLAGKATYEIEEKRLTITHGDRALGFRAR